MKADFGGYVTKANTKCSDGRVICPNAFKDCDGKTVPLIWHHLRDNPDNVLGHVLLENREDGVYGHAFFNNTKSAETAKELVRHGDINAMSIYANKLVQNGPNVQHGVIKEVSLVTAGANPGALIDNISIAHEDGGITELPDAAIIYSSETLEHSESYETDWEYEEEPEEVEHAEGDQNGGEKAASGSDKTLQQVFDTLNEDQKTLFYAMIGQALEDGAATEEEAEVEQSEKDEGGTDMKKNVFDDTAQKNEKHTLTHEDIETVFKNAKKSGSLRDAVEEMALEHGITNIESLFPDYKSLNNPPAWIGQPEAWVNSVWNGTSKTPFSRIKSAFADITMEEARARGYIKGKKKQEEQFSLLKRTTDPQTVYKKQSLDRDDILDITDFDVVAWLKSEMRMKLQEELSRAILIGDGRLASSDDKIQETHIRSILNDDDFYSLKHKVDMTGLTTSLDKANAIVDAVAYAMIDYKGSGGMTAYMSPQALADLKVARDKEGRRLYSSVSEIASALGVNSIVEVPLMKDQTRKETVDSTESTYKTLAILVNLRDYNVGADRGGQTTMFDDFDIDYNKYKYLIETRCSGALIRPASAIVLETKVATTEGGNS